MNCNHNDVYECPDCQHCFQCEHEFIYDGQIPGGWAAKHPVKVGWYDWSIKGYRYYFDASGVHQYSPHFRLKDIVV